MRDRFDPEEIASPFAGMTDAEIEAAVLRVLLASRGRVCAMWEALGKAWQALPVATFGAGWLIQPLAALYLPGSAELALGLSFVVFGCGLGVVRMRKVAALRKRGFGLEALGPFEREIARRNVELTREP